MTGGACGSQNRTSSAIEFGVIVQDLLQVLAGDASRLVVVPELFFRQVAVGAGDPVCS